MRCAAFTPMRGRYERCAASAVLMLTTPPGAGVPGASAANAEAQSERMTRVVMMKWDFRIGVISPFGCWLVDRNYVDWLITHTELLRLVVPKIGRAHV